MDNNKLKYYDLILPLNICIFSSPNTLSVEIGPIVIRKKQTGNTHFLNGDLAVYARFLIIGRETLVLTDFWTSGSNIFVFENQCFLEYVIVLLFGFSFGLVNYLLCYFFIAVKEKSHLIHNRTM